jgi:hypothetical protein
MTYPPTFDVIIPKTGDLFHDISVRAPKVCHPFWLAHMNSSNVSNHEIHAQKSGVYLGAQNISKSLYSVKYHKYIKYDLLVGRWDGQTDERTDG